MKLKVRETFDRIRHQNTRFSLRSRLTVLVAAEVITSVLFALGVSKLLDFILPPSIEIPLFWELAALILITSVIITIFMSKYFFDPIKKLRTAMGKVADGDFDVRLNTNTGSKEIDEIMSGFNLMTHELGATEVLQTDFVSNVSHEFKTPINAIEGYATLLQDSEQLSEEDRARYVEKILFNTKRLSDLMSNVLLLSKIDNQAIQSKQTEFRLDEQIRQCIVLLETEWIKKDIEFDVDMEDIAFVGNENLLHHVWYNLIGNAIKFDPIGGGIRIRLLERDGLIVFSIEDDGPGIDDETKKHIFDKFYQVDSSHKAEGNGLGLALTKRILDVMGGTVSAENLKQGGCRFTVSLNA